MSSSWPCLGEPVKVAPMLVPLSRVYWAVVEPPTLLKTWNGTPSGKNGGAEPPSSLKGTESPLCAQRYPPGGDLLAWVGGPPIGTENRSVGRLTVTVPPGCGGVT